jgi:hypothetical protein
MKLSEHSVSAPFLWNDPGRVRQAGEMDDPHQEHREHESLGPTVSAPTELSGPCALPASPAGLSVGGNAAVGLPFPAPGCA